MIVFIISISILVLDQLTKKLICLSFLPGQSRPIIENIFHLTLVYNKGIAFGLFVDRVIISVFISVMVIILLIVSVIKIKGHDLILKIAFSLILGGAAGNLVDRIRFGYVIDFLDFRVWPVFNLADTAITIGAGLLIVYLFKMRNFKSRARSKSQ